MTAGQSGAFTTSAKKMFKSQMKKGLKGLKKGVRKAAARSAKDYLIDNAESISVKAVDYLYSHNSQSFIDSVFNT